MDKERRESRKRYTKFPFYFL